MFRREYRSDVETGLVLGVMLFSAWLWIFELEDN
jgi:hypothetical protein